MEKRQTTVIAPETYMPYVRLEISDPKVVNTFVTIFREMASSALGENDFEQAEDMLHVGNELNEARNRLLDLIAEERDAEKSEYIDIEKDLMRRELEECQKN